MIRRLYDWTMGWADHPRALAALAVISFLESSIFPIPPDVIMIPMILANRRRAWLIAGVATAASVAGAMLGYLIGWGFYDSVGLPVLDFYHKAEAFEHFRTDYAAYGAWAVLVAGVTPFPFKVITLASGVTGLNFGVFVIASILARGLRFFLVAALLFQFGPPIRDFIERRLGLVFTAFCLILIAGFAGITLL